MFWCWQKPFKPYTSAEYWNVKLVYIFLMIYYNIKVKVVYKGYNINLMIKWSLKMLQDLIFGIQHHHILIEFYNTDEYFIFCGG